MMICMGDLWSGVSAFDSAALVMEFAKGWKVNGLRFKVELPKNNRFL